MRIKFFYLVIFILCFVMTYLGILLLSSFETLHEQDKKQKIITTSFLGEEFTQKLAYETQNSLKIYYLDTGLEASIYHYFIPTQQQQHDSKGLESLGEEYFLWVERKIKTLFTFNQFIIYKLTLISCLLPWYLGLCLVTVIEGEINRRSKRYRFELESAIQFGISLRALIALSVLLCFLWVLPFAWTIVFIMIALLLMVGCAYLLAANTHYY